jgi:hypothetical protein
VDSAVSIIATPVRLLVHRRLQRAARPIASFSLSAAAALIFTQSAGTVQYGRSRLRDEKLEKSGMRTLELLDYLIELARRLGYAVREEWLDGSGGGACVLKGQKILFVDQSLAPSDRIEQIARSLKGTDELAKIYVLPEARELLDAAA